MLSEENEAGYDTIEQSIETILFKNTKSIAGDCEIIESFLKNVYL